MSSPLLEIGAAFERARPPLQRDLPLVLPVGAAFLLLPQLLLARASGDLPGSAAELPAPLLLLVAATALAGLLFQIFMTSLVLQTAPGATVQTLLLAAARLLPAGLAISLVQAFAIVPGVALLTSGRPAFALPGLAAGFAGAWAVVRLMPAIPVLVAEGGGPVRAMARSWAMTAGHSLRLLGMFAVLLFGFLLLLLLFTGFGSAIAAAVTLVLGRPAEGWGAGRWIAELIEAGANSLLSASLAVFVALVYRLLAARG